MIDHESLEMIAQIIDQKLEANTAKLEASMDIKLEKLESRMDEKLEKLESRMDEKLEKLESRMDEKLEKLESRMDAKLNHMEHSLNHKIKMTEANLNLSITKLDTRVAHLDDDLHDVKLTLEHKLEPQIQLIAENYLPAVKRMNEATAKLKEMQVSIDVLNLTVARHSELLQCIV